LRGNLPAAWAAKEADARLAARDRLDALVRPVGRRVGGDHDVDELARVLDGEQILETALDHALLVVRGDDDRHTRPDGRLPDRPRTQARERGGRGGVADVRPSE
jgi:hypothetical protein